MLDRRLYQFPLRFLSLFLLFPCALHARPHRPHFETSLVRPVLLAGDRLLALQPATHRLLVHDTRPALRLRDEIPVGLGPVSLRVRPGHPDEVWVVNSVSDDISVVDLERGAVVGRVPAREEPFDVAFTPDGDRAYVTVSGRDRVFVVDANRRRVVGRIPTPGAAPRTVEMSRNGRHAIVSFFKSGNGTTVLPATHPDAPVTDPQVGLIIPSEDPRSPVHLEDVDVIAIRVSDDEITERISAVGTILFDHAIHPGNGKLYVAHTEARNLVQYEPALRGHVVDHRIAIVDRTGTGPATHTVDLNPHLDSGRMPDPGGREHALAQPVDLAFDGETGRIFVAAFGSGAVAVLDGDGRVLDRLAVGKGPRGLALDGKNRRLYVHLHLAGRIAVVDPDALTVLETIPLGSHDPEPGWLKRGRIAFYDANLSGNGTASCAVCHIDGDRDFLAWDLGDPDGPVRPGPAPGLEFSPLKGPMVTQTLRGLRGTGALHWRGDRASLLDFNPAFVSLLGNDRELPPDTMEDLRDFLLSIAAPSNPNLQADRTWDFQAARGFRRFREGDSYNACIHCHRLPTGTHMDFIPSPAIINLSQPFKPAKLTQTYTKRHRFEKTGFGYGQDGTFPSLVDFFSRLRNETAPAFPLDWKHDFSELVRQWDTGTAPSVGRQVLLDEDTARDGETRRDVEALAVEVSRVHCDLVAHGLVEGDGESRLFDPRTRRFRCGSRGRPGETIEDLIEQARAGAIWVLQGVAPGDGLRLSIDRDGDLLPDRQEAHHGTDPLVADSDGDGFLDGWEVLAGADPRDRTRVPLAMTRPEIRSARPSAGCLPFGDSVRRLEVTATDGLPGAEIEIVAPDGQVTRHPIFPLGAGWWSTSDRFSAELLDELLELGSLTLINPTGAQSPPLTPE